MSKFKLISKIFPECLKTDKQNTSPEFAGHNVLCIYMGRIGICNNVSVLSECCNRLWVTKVFPIARKDAANNELCSNEYRLLQAEKLKKYNIETLQTEAYSSQDFVMLRSNFYNDSRPLTSRDDYDVLSDYLLESSSLRGHIQNKLHELIDPYCSFVTKYFDDIVLELKECEIELTRQHGDFAPWNIKKLPRGGYLILDWEESGILPQYFDYVYFELRRRKVKFYLKDLITQTEKIIASLPLDNDRVRMALCAAHIYVMYTKGYILSDD
ncbi:hypothetical protein N9C80_02315 [Paracoccaceae bacterium]|nr:hypothetical protein [Paracoccaceae bacterium]